MSGMNRLIAPVLATVCGVCTAYAAFAPELQKQQAEREGKATKEFSNQHPYGVIPPTKTEQQAELHAPTQSHIDNNASIGAEVRDRITEAKTEIAPKKAWWGMSMLSGVLGGRENAKDKDSNEKPS